MEDVEGYRANLRRSTYGIYIYIYTYETNAGDRHEVMSMYYFIHASRNN